MIISNLKASITSDKAQISAHVHWENANKPDKVVYFSADAAYVEYLQLTYDAFFIAALVPAMRNGESRICVDGEVCPHLLDNLYEAMGWLFGWYDFPKDTLLIEAKKRIYQKTSLHRTPRSAIFLSGGVDSLSCLSHNLDHYPQGDPWRISAGVYIYGFDIGGQEKLFDGDAAISALEKVEKTLEPLCKDLAIDYIRIKTNIRHLDDTPGFWGEQFCGAAISSCGHALGNEFSHFFLSSAGKKIEKNTVFPPFGNHPVLDHNYSSEQVHVQHYQCRLDSRIKRISIVCDNKNILNSIRVCFSPPADKLNCERCEKCVRTKLELYILGKLEQAKSFSEPLRAEDIRRIDISNYSAWLNYVEIKNSLIDQNLNREFIAEVDSLLLRYKKWKAWKEETDIKGTIKRIDRRYFNSGLTKLLTR